MTNRERIWRRACSWVKGWQGGKAAPTPEMAYVAGWQAAMREMRKKPAVVWDKPSEQMPHF
jgi:hypothetical protein